MKKGEQTRQMILDVGLEMASRLGLESVSIGSLAKATAMSKSGVFAHFESKENLQVEILKYAADLFSQGVIVPALKTEAGVPRIKALVDNWIAWTSRMSGGCIFVSTSTAYSDRPGKVRDTLLRQQEDWLDCLRRIAQSAIRVGDLRKDIDSDQFAFDLYSLLLGFYLYHELFHNSDTKRRQETALGRLLSDYQ